ncbi:NifU family protein [Patescibacteria group bacterium]|nr:NifU family protein [Patescibacteria group bacterium]MBU1663648.1 NifU family protein [Patescibacteria group bacterium]MBU1934221.1 NifU family protein [Patescibacteria group bacterium]MBU2007940.1 NifU family protein [Patescibacteria group bacterium]MBU2233283.1 NifU family protein [Patescibacteria group bacterium]
MIKRKIKVLASTIDKIKSVLEQIRPSLQMDGGDVHFVNFDKKSGVLKVELMGHCVHCPMSQITLKQGIEAKIKKQVPWVKEVIAVPECSLQ